MKLLKPERILIVFGTRPEAIKMALLVQKLQSTGDVDVRVCVTAQHRGMLDQVLDLFSIVPEYDLNLMQPNQTLSSISAAILAGVTVILNDFKPDLVLVHGDTTTSFATALACFYMKIPTGHIEAGLRTFDMYAPWPEEMNRRFIGQLATLHFAPTISAKNNLLQEGVAESFIWVTGNTVIDTLQNVVARLNSSATSRRKLEASLNLPIRSHQRLIVVTGHRRENFGDGVEQLCLALKRLAEERDVLIVYPVHPNPNILRPVHGLLANNTNIRLVEPLDYLPFVYLMNKAFLIITDSGGIQEEAPSLGKPVLVTRDVTERPEAVEAGTVRIIGSNAERIFNEACLLLDDDSAYQKMSSAHNPYGDGRAVERIVQVIRGNKEINEFV